MFAVIKTGGKQYRVAANDKITIGRIEGDAGSSAEFGEVLALGGDTPSFGAPFVDGARVVYEIVEHTRGDKVIAFKKRRRQNSKRKRGHRQDLTVIRITDILAAGQKAGSKAKAKKAAPAAAPEEAAKPAANEQE
ncbi:50S ribosomal protein L21 [Terrihabitans sp. B22-R8]|uniref:50S ribosomal protein L21 n=1 Tax=Terrihabitans sp. B22-R8 TaxID=3425128 RepID=UPI00403CB336